MGRLFGLRIVWGFTLIVLVLLGCSCGGDDDSASDDDDDTDDDDDGDDDDAADDDDAGDDDSTPDYPDYPNDDRLRLNEIQVLGTHNSYHVHGQPITIPFLDYTLPPLGDQLALGVRQFELDIHYNQGNGMKVYHLPALDFGTTCEYFVDCLSILKDWSDAHPGHQPLVVFVEPKDELDSDKLAGHDAEVEDEILAVWPRERIVAPDDVRGGYATLNDALIEDGWPALGETRDKALFICFDSGEFRDQYVETDPVLAGRLLFPRGDFDEPWGCFKNIDDPIEEPDRINEAVDDGFLIRTRADANCAEAYGNDTRRQQAAMETGAQFISTDFPVPHPDTGYMFTIPDGTPSRCNPRIAPDFCIPEDVENLLEE